jgi:hypothetical protein
LPDTSRAHVPPSIIQVQVFDRRRKKTAEDEEMVGKSKKTTACIFLDECSSVSTWGDAHAELHRALEDITSRVMTVL